MSQRLPVAVAEFALYKLHMTLTILRKNKNTTTTKTLTPINYLRLAQDPPHGSGRFVKGPM